MAHHKFDVAHLHWGWTGDALLVVVLGALFTNSLIPYTTDQAVVQRYLTTTSPRQAARAIWTNGIMAVLTGVLFLTIGTALFAFYQARPSRLTDLDAPDQIFAVFIVREMPAGLAGLVIAGVFAAAMSTLDSSIHSIATVVTTDIVRRFRPALAGSTYLAVARSLVVVFGVSGTVAAMWMVTAKVEYLWDYFLGIMGLLGGTLAGLFALGVFTTRTRTWHAWLGVVASMGVLLYVRFCTDLNALLYGAIGVTTCFGVGGLAGRVRPARTPVPRPGDCL